MFSLPPLPYAYDALEPYIDARTMELHHTKHHQTYVDTLNKALAEYPEYASWQLIGLLERLQELPDALRQTVRNHGGGHYNHSLFWQLMKPHASNELVGTSKKEIIKQFGSLEQFKQQFSEAGKKCFGSGWVWLVPAQSGNLEIQITANQDTPVMRQVKPILGLDVWEHAYYLHYQNRRVDYITAWWNTVNWEHVEELYTAHR